MIIEKNNLFIKKVRFIFEEIGDLEKLKSNYDCVTIMSQQKLDLPGFSLLQKKTSVINLSIGKEAVFRNFNDTTRNEINKTFKNSALTFSVAVFGEHYFYAGHSLYTTHELAQGRVPESLKYFQKHLFFIASLNNQPIAAISVYPAKNILRIKSISSKRVKTDNKELIKTISCASRRLVWEICLYGIKNGFTGVDLAYVNLNDPKKQGITGFKMGFGGKVVDDYTYTYKSEKFKFLEKFVDIINFFKKLIFKIFIK